METFSKFVKNINSKNKELLQELLAELKHLHWMYNSMIFHRKIFKPLTILALLQMPLTLGMDDYLMSLANDHETNIYLLKQISS